MESTGTNRQFKPRHATFKPHHALLMQAVIWLLVTATVVAQPVAPKPMSDADLLASLKAHQKEVAEATDLDDATKVKVGELYKQAIDEMAVVKQWAETASQHRKLRLAAPGEIKRIKAELAAPPAKPTSVGQAETTLPQIEQNTSQCEAQLGKLRKELTDDKEELKTRLGRRAKIAEQLAAAQKILADLTAQPQTPPATDEKPAVNSARNLCLIVQRRMAEQEIECHQQELGAYEARTEWLPLHHDLKTHEITLKQNELLQWQNLADRRRKQEVEQQVQHASHEASQAHSATLVRKLADDNAELATQRKSLMGDSADVTCRRDRADREARCGAEAVQGHRRTGQCRWTARASATPWGYFCGRSGNRSRASPTTFAMGNSFNRLGPRLTRNCGD